MSFDQPSDTPDAKELEDRRIEERDRLLNGLRILAKSAKNATLRQFLIDCGRFIKGCPCILIEGTPDHKNGTINWHKP